MDAAMLDMLMKMGPMWVISAMVIVGMGYVGRLFLVTWLPAIFEWLRTVFEHHIAMLQTATESMAKSAVAIETINTKVADSTEKIVHGQSAIADAAIPACKAILVVTPPEKQQEVRQHLDEVTRILNKPSARGH